MRTFIFIWASILILLSSLSVSSQTVSKDTSQTEILKLQKQAESFKTELEKLKDEGYQKAIEGANQSILISTLVVVFVTFIAIVVGIFGYYRIKEIKREYEKTKEELKSYKEQIERICQEIEEKGKSAERKVQEIEDFRKTIESQAKEVPTDFSKDVSKLTKKDSKTAIQEYEKVMDKIFDEKTHSTMAYNYYVEGRYEDCITELKKVIRLNPQSHDAYSNWGVALAELGRHEEEIEKYKKATELKPDFAEAYVNWGAALGKLGRHEEAIEKCKKATELKPGFAGAWYNIACVRSLQNNKPEALKNLRKAIELDPSNKEDAKKEGDFKNLWEDEDFKKLVG